MDRRKVLTGSAAATVVALLGSGCTPGARTTPRSAGPRDAQVALGFTGVAPGTADAVAIPPEYTAQVLYPWGAAAGIAGSGAVPAFSSDTRTAANSADDQALQAGMHHDGMHWFALPGHTERGLLVVNHEYTDEALLHRDGVARWTPEKVRRSQHAVGVSVIEIFRDSSGGWQQVTPSPYARRIHARTPCRLSGPVAGTDAMRTQDDPTGREVRGTLANCAMGVTPWGTYLSCEENFHGYFGAPAAAANTATHAQRRYGTVAGAQWVDWWRFEPRFDLTREPNEAHRFGWVVEIDPFDPGAMPVKRTALGRKRHESATCRVGVDGRIAVYMGDDARFEYLYKFITRDAVRAGWTRRPDSPRPPTWRCMRDWRPIPSAPRRWTGRNGSRCTPPPARCSPR